MSPTDVVSQEKPTPSRTKVVNDFSIQVATVNGSGSQTANLVLLRSILLMGIPVSGKNMFPSNIAGLPTWYTIRASKRGYVGRKKEVDFLVAMNPETAKEDVMTLEAGAAVVYDEPLKLNALRSDLTFYPVPFDKLVTAVCPDAKLRRLVRNMIYDGILAKLLGIDMSLDGAGAREAARQEGQGRHAEPGRAEGRLGFRGSDLHEAGSVSHRADERDGRQDPHRRQRGRGDRLHDGRRHRRRVVSDYAVLVAVRIAHRLHAEVPHGQGDRQGDVRHRSGRRRDCVARHGDRRRMGRRAGDDRDGRTRHFADVGVRGPRLLRRDAGRHLRRAARGAVDGPADPDGAGRPAEHRLPLARRHQAHPAASRARSKSATSSRCRRSTCPSGSRRPSS